MNLENTTNDSKKSTETKNSQMRFMSAMTSSYAVPKLSDDEGRKNWVPWGKKDDFATELTKLYNNSGFHRAIIDARVNMMVGSGVVQDLEEAEESKRTEHFINNPNPFEDLTTIYSKLAYDFELYGIAYIELQYSDDRSQIARIDHIDASKIRWGKKVQNHLTHVFYSQNWEKPNKYPPEAIPVFNPAIKDEFSTQIIPIVRYTPGGVDYYTLPSYYSILKWVNIDAEISTFHLNNIEKGFVPTMHIGHSGGIPTDDEMASNERAYDKKFAGTEGVKTVFTYTDGENPVKVDVLDITDADKQYEWLLKATQQEILIGHKVTNENLAGISTPGKLGNSSELLDSYELYYNDVIKHEISVIIKALNKVMAYNGMNDVMIEQDFPVSNTLSETTLKDILTPNELREMIGYSPIEVVEEVIDTNEELMNGDLLGIIGKEVEPGDTINFNGIDLKLSQTVIDANTGIDTEADEKDMYAWSLGSGGLSKENCPVCLKNAGEVRALRRWKRVGIPGTKAETFGGKYKYGAYGTFCEADCTCKLIKIT